MSPDGGEAGAGRPGPRGGSPDEIRRLVRDGYTRIAEVEATVDAAHAHDVGRRLGYSEEQLREVPEGANLGVGCGNPTAIDALHVGETVVDLGSGAGMDAFLAARKVGNSGRVIGVDMTDAMLVKARANAERVGLDNVEFRKGMIEALPIDDASVDVVISNCVINLSPEKPRVFQEIHRVLRPGGRMMISDLVLERPLPPEVMASADLYLGCIGGASLRADYLAAIGSAGFRAVRVVREASFADAIDLTDARLQEVIARLGISETEAREFAAAVTSLHVFAVK